MHTVQEKKKLLSRVRRLRGQIEAVERALEAEQGCYDVLTLVAAVRGAVDGLVAELIAGHVRAHVLSSQATQAQRDAAEELLDVVRTYVR